MRSSRPGRPPRISARLTPIPKPSVALRALHLLCRGARASAADLSREGRQELAQAYEVMVMIDPESDEARQESILERVREIVEQGGGTFESVDAWGRRKLEYEINKKSEATYHIVNFSSSGEVLDEVARVLKITDDVMRHMAVRRSGRSHGTQSEDAAPVS